MPIWGYFMAGTALLSFFGGWEVRGWRDDSAQLFQTKAQIQAIAKASEDAFKGFAIQNGITFTVGEKTAVENTKIVTRTITLVKEVPIYVSPEANRACVVNLGAVRLLNRAASGADESDASFPITSGQSNDTATAVDLATLASSVAENYGRCQENANELKGLQEWIKEQQAASAERKK